MIKYIMPLSVAFVIGCTTHSPFSLRITSGAKNIIHNPIVYESFQLAEVLSPWQHIDIKNIVVKHIPLGTPKQQVMEKLKMFKQEFTEYPEQFYFSDGRNQNVIQSSFKETGHPMVHRKGIFMELYFNHENKLDEIHAQYRVYQ